MAGASASTSWEGHALGGPFVLLKESRSLGDFIFTGIVCSFILVPCAHWVWTGRLWSAIVAVVTAGLSIILSILAAASASV